MAKGKKKKGGKKGKGKKSGGTAKTEEVRNPSTFP